jgi:hypothetical protein
VQDFASLIAEREDALRSQFLGNSPRVSADEAAQAVEAARGDLVSDIGKAYGLGLCLTKDLGDVANEDGITLVVTVTDGQREATIDVKSAGRR